MKMLLIILVSAASLMAEGAGRSGCRGPGCSEPAAVVRPARDCTVIWAEITALQARIDALPAGHPFRLALGWKLARLMAEYAAAACNEPC